MNTTTVPYHPDVGPGGAPLVLPLPEEVDLPAVVLVGMLMGQGCDVVLDASAVRTLGRRAADALAATVRTAELGGGSMRIHGASPRLRARLTGHPLAAALAAGGDLRTDEAALTCPFLDETGFRPSMR